METLDHIIDSRRIDLENLAPSSFECINKLHSCFEKIYKRVKEEFSTARFIKILDEFIKRSSSLFRGICKVIKHLDFIFCESKSFRLRYI